jgi:hypothetical protein
MKISYRISRLFIYTPALTALMMFSSCTYPHYYHSPNMMTVPLFNKGGEWSTMLAGSFGSVNPSFEMQTAFSFPAHIALGINYMTGGKDNSGDYYTDLSKNHYFEGFGGFYTSFQKIGVFEFYAGYGEGNEQHTFAYNDWDWGGGSWIQDGDGEMKFSRIFFQPDIGLRTKFIEGAFSLRLSRIDFKEIEYHNTYYRLNELKLLQSHPDSWLIEPGITFRGGHDPLKFQIQALFSMNPSNPDLSFERFRFNIGLNLKFGLNKKTPVEKIQTP